MNSKLVSYSKIALFFVMLGFFLPILNIPLVGTVNGVRIAHLVSELELNHYAFVIWLIPIFALLGLLLQIISLAKKEPGENPVFLVLDFDVLIGMFVCGLILFRNIKEFTGDAAAVANEAFWHIATTGFYFIVIGWIASFALLVTAVVGDFKSLREQIDKLPVFCQLLVGLHVLAGIALVGFLCLWLIDIVLLDADPIGHIFGLSR